MSGVVFMICIPTKEYELTALKNQKKKVTIGKCTETIHYNVEGASNDFIGEVAAIPPININRNSNQTMEEILTEVLKDHDITNATWCRENDQNYMQIIFSLESNDRCDDILEILQENRFGRKLNSVVSVIPCNVHFQTSHSNEHQHSSHLEEIATSDSYHDEKTAWKIFVSSVRSRLAVAQVVENVKHRAALTFDFICLILISTTLCAIGLVENSNVYLLSSMLISPMMGPVMAGTFGSVIQDKRLQKIGVLNEMIGLGIAMMVGFCYGSLICIITDKYGTQDWPTYEMVSRGELRSLWVGCLIALLSGAAVALGILSDNIASLVGVAISTSLMPPAVNAGLLWSMASVYSLKGNETMKYTALTKSHLYSDNEPLELLVLGGISVCLTLVNLICIFIAGILVFKIKEVAPITCRDQARRRFWGHDIKVAREHNKIDSEESRLLYDSYYSHKNKVNNDNLCHSTDLAKDNNKVNVRRPEYTWSPCMAITKKIASELQKNDKRYAPSTSGAQTSKPKQRRLSQIFSPYPTDSDKLHIIHEGNEKTALLKNQEVQTGGEGSSKSICTTSKRFTVTRCEDPLEKKETS